MRLPLSVSTLRTLLSVVLRTYSHPDEKGETAMRGDDYNDLYLESTSHPLAIPPQAYEQIVAIAQAHRICTSSYTPTYEEQRLAARILGLKAVVYPLHGDYPFRFQISANP